MQGLRLLDHRQNRSGLTARILALQLPFFLDPQQKRLATCFGGDMIAKSGFAVKVGGNATGKTACSFITAQALNRSLPTALAVLIELQVIEGAAHALLDIENLAYRPFRSHPVKGVARSPVRLSDLELYPPAHVSGLAENEFQLVADLLHALA